MRVARWLLACVVLLCAASFTDAKKKKRGSKLYDFRQKQRPPAPFKDLEKEKDRFDENGNPRVPGEKMERPWYDDPVRT